MSEKTIGQVAFIREPNLTRRDAYLAKAMAFADVLEARKVRQ